MNIDSLRIYFSFCETLFCHEARILSFFSRALQTDFEFFSFFSVYETYRPDKLESSPRLLTLAVLSVEFNNDDRSTSSLLFIRIYRCP